jgi:hypothetical protein
VFQRYTRTSLCSLGTHCTENRAVITAFRLHSLRDLHGAIVPLQDTQQHCIKFIHHLFKINWGTVKVFVITQREIRETWIWAGSFFLRALQTAPLGYHHVLISGQTKFILHRKSYVNMYAFNALVMTTWCCEYGNFSVISLSCQNNSKLCFRSKESSNYFLL